MLALQRLAAVFTPNLLGARPPNSKIIDLIAFALLTGIPILVAAWALLSPGRVLSSEMTWDFLFNLAGAWHLENGHVAHVDFHDPVGQLNFLLTVLGFRLIGLSPLAVIVGSLVWVLVTFVAASVVVRRRLPLLPAAAFVVFVCLLVVMPANIGDQPRDYSFAMAYNRYGWSAVTIVAMILFLPPRFSSRTGEALDMLTAGLLLVALFYLKITYFAVGFGAVVLSLLLFPHVRSRWKGWLVVTSLVVANALASYNHPYLLDLWTAVEAGQARGVLGVHLNTVLSGPESNAFYAAGLAVALCLWWRGLAPVRIPVAISFLLAAGTFLLTQNHQAQGIPLTVLIAVLLYDQLRQLPLEGQPYEPLSRVAPALIVLTVFLSAMIATSFFSLVSYRVDASRDERLLVIGRTALKGLAVPFEPPGLLAAFAEEQGGPSLLNRARILRPQHELSPMEYVETLLEAASLFDAACLRLGGIVVIDQVNPLPFMLGLPPPKGGSLWSGWGVPVRPSTEVFIEADHVLIPKFPTYSPGTDKAMRTYGAYLAENFGRRHETQSWIVLSREEAVSACVRKPNDKAMRF